MVEDFERTRRTAAPVVAKKLGELTAESRQLEVRRAEVATQIVEHLRNVRGWRLPLKAFATEYNGGNGFKPYGDDHGSVPGRGAQLPPDYYEIGPVYDELLGTSVILYSGDVTFKVRPSSIEAVTEEDILAHRAKLVASPETKDPGYY